MTVSSPECIIIAQHNAATKMTTARSAVSALPVPVQFIRGIRPHIECAPCAPALPPRSLTKKYTECGLLP